MDTATTIYTPDTAPVAPHEPQVVIAPYMGVDGFSRYEVAYVRNGDVVGDVVRKYSKPDALNAAAHLQNHHPNAPIVYLPKGY